MPLLSLSLQRTSFHRLQLHCKQITVRPFHSTLRNYLAHKGEAMATTHHDESHDYFHYNSGRWLWGEEEQLRERYRAFNVNELQKVAVGIAGSEKCVSMSKIGEGNFNKVFRLQMDNGSVLMARIPHPNAGPPKHTTTSEVATMDFVRQNIHFLSSLDTYLYRQNRFWTYLYQRFWPTVLQPIIQLAQNTSSWRKPKAYNCRKFGTQWI